MSPALPLVVLLSASSLWGLTWIPLKHFGSFGIEGPLVTLGAHGSVGLMAVPFLWRRWSGLRGQWTGAALLLFFGGLANLAFAWAMVIGDVTRVMVLFYLLPAWGVLGGRVILKERVDGARALSLGFALGGAFFVLGGLEIGAAAPGLAEVLAVLAGFSLATNNVMFRKLQSVPVPTKIAVNFVGCLLWASTLMLLGVREVPAGVPTGVWFQLSAFGMAWIFLATIGTLWAVHHMEAGRSSVLIIMELLTAVVSFSWATGKAPSVSEWLGGALIVVSALLEARRNGQVVVPAVQ
jgi:drug/metabolite transporter (DMT)-like permease